MAQAGANVDKRRDRVYVPRRMVEAALKTIDRNVVLYSQDGRHDLQLRGKRVHLGTGGAAVHVLDLESGRVRESVLRDLYDIVQIWELWRFGIPILKNSLQTRRSQVY